MPNHKTLLLKNQAIRLDSTLNTFCFPIIHYQPYLQIIAFGNNSTGTENTGTDAAIFLVSILTARRIAVSMRISRSNSAFHDIPQFLKYIHSPNPAHLKQSSISCDVDAVLFGQAVLLEWVDFLYCSVMFEE